MSQALYAEIKKLQARVQELELRPACKCDAKPVNIEATVSPPKRPILTLKKQNG